MKKILKSKKFWVSFAVVFILMVAGSGIFILNTVYQRINVSRSEAHVIALKRFPGTVVKSEMDFDDFEIYYDLEIVDHNQQRIEVTISSYDGSIVDYERD
ncbi:hypothetical protein H5999_07225 [[Clostridium] spiroforme]|nr:hypothetical protein [Thomasclavelia spiroformis]